MNVPVRCVSEKCTMVSGGRLNRVRAVDATFPPSVKGHWVDGRLTPLKGCPWNHPVDLVDLHVQALPDQRSFLMSEERRSFSDEISPHWVFEDWSSWLNLALAEVAISWSAKRKFPC